MLESLIKQLEKELDIDIPAVSNTLGTYTFSRDEGLTMTLSEISQGLSLRCHVAACPKMKQEAFFAHAMLGNLFGQGTRGAILGLNDEGDVLTLTQIVDYPVNYKDFKEILEDFTNSIEFWREETRNHQ
jgi:Tir chaperone protein (CesT) family